MKDFNEIFQQMLNGKYYSPRELQYDTKAGLFLSPYEYHQYLEFVNEIKSEDIIELDLLSFNKQKLHIINSVELSTMVSNYLDIVAKDIESTKSFLSTRNADEITLSRIYSEIEGTLNIESVPTTRKVIEELNTGKKDPSNLNEQIIYNMLVSIQFVNSMPDFNADNLYHLYQLLSDGCLDEEDCLLNGYYYRHDGVEVGGYKGCPVDKIEECMDSLFAFINSNLKNPYLKNFLPHIAHYYIAYVHPYFDYNGRTARMVSYWVSLLTNSKHLPPIISEAINQTKKKYYDSLSNTRNSFNDLSYFLLYIYEISITYFLTYKNIEEIENVLKEKDVSLSMLEKNYLKKILISQKGKFDHEDFTKWININMSKQGSLKILNSFEKYGILESSISSSKKKLFKIKQNILKYETKY